MLILFDIPFDIETNYNLDVFDLAIIECPVNSSTFNQNQPTEVN